MYSRQKPALCERCEIGHYCINGFKYGCGVAEDINDDGAQKTMKQLKTLLQENPDVVVDGTDNFSSRYLINDAATANVFHCD